VLANQGFPQPYTGFQGAHNEPIEPNEKGLKPPEGQLEEAPNLAQIDRGYWLAGNPLPVTEQNLLRGKEVFNDRCVGCHGLAGDGKGPGARFLSPTPATSPTRTTRAAAATPGQATSTTASCAAGRERRWRTSAIA
jgi:mono/diheme cytochrome c family protein